MTQDSWLHPCLARFTRLKRAARPVKMLSQNTRAGYASRRYCRESTGAHAVDPILQRAIGRDALLVTIAFNEPRLIAMQLKALKRNFQDSCVVVVADNSTDPIARSAIESLCKRSGDSYLPLPPNPAKSGSSSHGLAMNWVYYNVLSRTSTQYFGFLDHDVFPLKPVSYRDVIRQQRSYGTFQTAGHRLFYWPGLCFFGSDYFGSRPPNFLPRMFSDAHGDTGASNWRRHYRNLDVGVIRSFALRDARAENPEQSYHKLSVDDEERLHHFVAHAVTFFDDDWVHLVNGSNWAAVNMETKLSQLELYLKRREE